MVIQPYQSVAAFQQSALTFLLQREAENGLMIGLLDALSRDPHEFSSEDPVLLEVRQDDGSQPSADKLDDVPSLDPSCAP